MNELYREVLRLYDHPGYPNKEHLKCPIWSQNKYDYIAALSQEDMVNRTLKIELNGC